MGSHMMLLVEHTSLMWSGNEPGLAVDGHGTFRSRNGPRYRQNESERKLLSMQLMKLRKLRARGVRPLLGPLLLPNQLHGIVNMNPSGRISERE